MHIEIDPRRPQADDGPVITMRFDKDAMGEIRGYIAERGNDEIRALFDEAEPVVENHSVPSGEEIDDPFREGERIQLMEARDVEIWTITLPQAARQPFVSVLQGIGAGGTADELAEILDA